MKKSILVVNDEVGVEKGIIQSLIINLLPKLVRHDKMEDRDFLVVPMVILTEGVHHGSDGPLFYPREELAKTPASWNHKPVVVYHPEMNGMGVSACDPDIISNRKVGVMMNTKFQAGKLRSEAWIEVDRANKVDERIMAAIEGNEMMELSTGVFIDCEDTDGEWKGEPYKGIARNFRPDHLALLPDKIGACSIADGAGFLRNQSAADDMLKKAQAMLKKAKADEDEEGVKKAQAMMSKAKDMMARMESSQTDNEMSFGNISSSLSAALRQKLNPNDNGPFVFLESVYSDFVIYEVDAKLYRLGYTASDTGVSLSSEKPVEVKRVTEYRTVDGAFVGNVTKNAIKNQKSMNKEAMIIAILAANIGFAETDRPKLVEMTDDQIKGIHNGLPKTPPETKEVKGQETTPAKNEQTTTQPPVTEPEKKIVTLESYISEAPTELQDVLKSSLAMHEGEKARLVDGICTNKDNTFAKEDLQKKSLAELRGLARLAGVGKSQQPAANYAGQGNVPSANAGDEEPLVMPTINFERK
jgi:hypothetical protein